MASRTNQVAISIIKKPKRKKPFASYQSHMYMKNEKKSALLVKFKTIKDNKLSTLMFKFSILPFRQF